VCEFLVSAQAFAVGHVNDDEDVEPFQVFVDEGSYFGTVEPTHTCRETRQGEAGGEHFFCDQPGKRLQRMIDIVQASLSGHSPHAFGGVSRQQADDAHTAAVLVRSTPKSRRAGLWMALLAVMAEVLDHRRETLSPSIHVLQLHAKQCGISDTNLLSFILEKKTNMPVEPALLHRSALVVASTL
jgi:hypothetical protein